MGEGRFFYQKVVDFCQKNNRFSNNSKISFQAQLGTAQAQQDNLIKGVRFVQDLKKNYNRKEKSRPLSMQTQPGIFFTELFVMHEQGVWGTESPKS